MSIELIAGALLLLSTAASGKTTLFGDIVASYSYYQHGTVLQNDTTAFTLDQVDLGIMHDFSDYWSGLARLTAYSGVATFTEAYIMRDGLPMEGTLTFGKFYKPLGAPIPLSNSSFSQLMFHSYPQVGAKAKFRNYPMEYEAGVVNGYPLTTIISSSARLGGTPILSSVNTTEGESDHEKDIYGRIAYSGGEDWGSLTTGVTFTQSELTAAELRALNPRGPAPSFIGDFRTVDRRDKRRIWTVDFDYQKGPYRVYGEHTHARDGRLRRDVWSAAFSRTFFHRFGQMTATVGYDKLDHNLLETRLFDPKTWERSRTSASLGWWPNEAIQVLGEYDWNRESVQLNDGKRVPNDEFTLQTIFYY